MAALVVSHLAGTSSDCFSRQTMLGAPACSSLSHPRYITLRLTHQVPKLDENQRLANITVYKRLPAFAYPLAHYLLNTCSATKYARVLFTLAELDTIHEIQEPRFAN